VTPVLAGSFPPRPPFPPERPLPPGRPFPPERPAPAPSPYPAVTPVRVWADPGQWPGRVYERLFERRIVMAHGHLDGEAASRLCAQLLTLNAEGDGPVRLELQGLDAELPAALMVIGVLETVRVPVLAYAAGRISGPALGVLAACGSRRAYPNAVFALSEPRMSYDGAATSITAQEQQGQAMLDALWLRIAETTGREVDDIRDDASRERFFTVDEAIAYGLIEESAAAH
jgi:ATP-dependent Clp protease protease subunit